MSSPCWSLLHLLSSSPPQHEAPPGQHDLLQDDTVHRAPLPEPNSRQAALMNRSRTSITRVAETRNTSPTGYEPKMTQADDFEVRRIELDRNLGIDLQPRRIELDRNPGTGLQPRRIELDMNIGTDP